MDETVAGISPREASLLIWEELAGCGYRAPRPASGSAGSASGPAPVPDRAADADRLLDFALSQSLDPETVDGLVWVVRHFPVNWEWRVPHAHRFGHVQALEALLRQAEQADREQRTEREPTQVAHDYAAVLRRLRSWEPIPEAAVDPEKLREDRDERIN